MSRADPVIAVTVGDPCGIGPEVAVRAARSPRVRASCRPLLIGPIEALRRSGWKPEEGPALFIDSGSRAGRLRPGLPGPDSGRSSFRAVELAVRLALRGKVAGIVTGPVSKAAWDQADVGFRDHTEFLERVCAGGRAEMLLISGPLRAVPVTRHIPLRKVPGSLQAVDIRRAARLQSRFLKSALGIRSPRIGLCALNPHAGEGGLLGMEEGDVLKRAVRSARAEGVRLVGPLPADSAWAMHRQGDLDGLVALYHDQALIPLKVLGGPVVNVTLGLPIVRTSPGHGAAFDIAGTGRARPDATVEALLLAARLVLHPHATG